jgi:hypothetical protein
MSPSNYHTIVNISPKLLLLLQKKQKNKKKKNGNVERQFPLVNVGITKCF